MEHSNKHKRGEKEEVKEEANESGVGNVNKIEVLEPAECVNLRSGVKRKIADLDVSEPGASDTGSSIATAIKANNCRAITPPVFNDRFTRMELNKEVLIRTNKGFLEFFNLNSHLTLKECWKEQSVKDNKGDLEKKD